MVSCGSSTMEQDLGFALRPNEIGADSNLVEALQRELSKAKADAHWWWLRFLGKDLESRGAPALKISSPLNTHEQLVNAPRGQGPLWSCYAASCPCCKRPIDLTVVHYGGSLASMAMRYGSAVADLGGFLYVRIHWYSTTWRHDRCSWPSRGCGWLSHGPDTARRCH